AAGGTDDSKPDDLLAAPQGYGKPADDLAGHRVLLLAEHPTELHGRQREIHGHALYRPLDRAVQVRPSADRYVAREIGPVLGQGQSHRREHAAGPRAARPGAADVG